MTVYSLRANIDLLEKKSRLGILSILICWVLNVNQPMCSKASVPIYYLVNKDAYNKDSQIIPKILGEEKHTIHQPTGAKNRSHCEEMGIGIGQLTNSMAH
jgi:hypothetical protein